MIRGGDINDYDLATNAPYEKVIYSVAVNARYTIDSGSRINPHRACPRTRNICKLRRKINPNLILNFTFKQGYHCTNALVVFYALSFSWVSWHLFLHR
jgi:hypothetical protein